MFKAMNLYTFIDLNEIKNEGYWIKQTPESLMLQWQIDDKNNQDEDVIFIV